jgi:hypothetical protein
MPDISDLTGRGGGVPLSRISDDAMFGYKVRQQLYPGEDSYFRANPNVAGMAAETNDVILNPYSQPSVNRGAVARNEALRLHLKNRGIKPDFQVTPQQREAFRGTAYETDEDALRATIAARIYSGDPSSLATAEQEAWLKALLSGQNR